MAVFSLDSTLIYFNDVDMASFTNNLSVDASVAEHDVTTFASAGWEESLGGLASAQYSIGGFWGFADPDDVTFTAVTTDPADPLITATPNGAAGDVAYFFRPFGSQRAVGGNIGDPAAVTLSGAVKSALYRGGLSLANQTITGATNGSSVQFSGGIPATTTVAVGVHVFADNATSMDLIVERDDNGSFTTPTTVTTIAVTATGTYWYEAAGPGGSDDYWRIRAANLVGTSFDVAASIGITN